MADPPAARQTKETLSETLTLAEARPVPGSTGRYRVALIRAGWGSSGYYPDEVLERDGPRIWPAGTQQYLNHPTLTEQQELPERRVQDWASEIVTDPVWDPVNRELVAEVQVFPQWQALLNPTFAKKVGLSIRACGEAEHGEAEGREGPIIKRLTEGISVDWVTKAGAGGRVLELIESARQEFSEARSIGGWLESRLHCMFTEITDGMYGDGRLTRDERIGLSSAIGDALGAFVTRIETDYPQLYQRDLYDGPDEPDTSARMAEATQPAPPAQPTTIGAPMGDPTGTPPSGAAPTTDVSEAAQVRTELAETKQRLAEAELKVAQLGENATKLAAAEAKLAEAERTNLRLIANNTARDKATETLAESTLPTVAHAKVIASVTGDNVPLNDDGALDEAALVKNIKAAIEAEREYLTRFAESAGIGQVRGLGGGSAPQVDTEKELGEVFASLGMSESAAVTAAKGRG